MLTSARFATDGGSPGVTAHTLTHILAVGMANGVTGPNRTRSDFKKESVRICTKCWEGLPTAEQIEAKAHAGELAPNALASVVSKAEADARITEKEGKLALFKQKRQQDQDEMVRGAHSLFVGACCDPSQAVHIPYTRCQRPQFAQHPAHWLSQVERLHTSHTLTSVTS
jgi:hypothetical protein